LIAVTVVRIKQAIFAAVKLYIFVGYDMNRIAETAWLAPANARFSSSINCQP